jgi:hypothetical protein
MTVRKKNDHDWLENPETMNRRRQLFIKMWCKSCKIDNIIS